MFEYQLDTIEYDSAETNELTVSIGEIPENAQITVKDTGWSEEEKEHMKQFGYDGLDMVRAWYSKSSKHKLTHQGGTDFCSAALLWGAAHKNRAALLLIAHLWPLLY